MCCISFQCVSMRFTQGGCAEWMKRKTRASFPRMRESRLFDRPAGSPLDSRLRGNDLRAREVTNRTGLSIVLAVEAAGDGGEPLLKISAQGAGPVGLGDRGSHGVRAKETYGQEMCGVVRPAHSARSFSASWSLSPESDLGARAPLDHRRRARSRVLRLSR